MDGFFIKLSNLLGGNIAPDHLKLAFSIMSTYPCAIVFKQLKSIWIKHLFSIGYTLFIMLSVLKMYTGFIHITATSLVSYLLMKFFKGPKVAWLNFALAMASMSICHIGRQIKNIEGDTELDYSGALMILTIKLSSYGFNILDGQQQQTTKLTVHNQLMKISTYPSLLQYFGWIFFFAGFLAGPTCEYMDYIRFIESPLSTPQLNQSVVPALKRLGKSLFFMLGLVYLAPTFNYFEALKPEWITETSFWYKMFFIQMAAVLTRVKYYCVWYLSEGACILSGFGFNGYDKDTGKPLWNKLTNVNVLSCELAQSYKTLTENWNIGANHWLRHYVYLRFAASSGSASVTLKTYIVSSLWHGFHPGFYLFFMISSSLQILARKIRRTVRPLFMTLDDPPQPKPYWKTCYDVCTWVVSMGLLNMLVPCFDLLHIPKILHVWRGIYYCHFIIIAFGTSLFFISMPFLISAQKSRINKQKQHGDNNSHKKEAAIVNLKVEESKKEQ